MNTRSRRYRRRQRGRMRKAQRRMTQQPISPGNYGHCENRLALHVAAGLRRQREVARVPAYVRILSLPLPK
jgi:hypothetical protein